MRFMLRGIYKRLAYADPYCGDSDHGITFNRSRQACIERSGGGLNSKDIILLLTGTTATHSPVVDSCCKLMNSWVYEEVCSWGYYFKYWPPCVKWDKRVNTQTATVAINYCPWKTTVTMKTEKHQFTNPIWWHSATFCPLETSAHCYNGWKGASRTNSIIK